MKKAGNHILILPEGWTEYYYVLSLRNSLPRKKQRGIQIKMPKPDHQTSVHSLLKKAEEQRTKAKREGNPFDAIWLVFDNDNQPRLPEFFNRLDLTKYRIAYSSICLEHWFILHLSDVYSAFTSSQAAVRELETLWKSHFNNLYKKTDNSHFDLLRKYMPAAIDRAKHLTNQHIDSRINLAQLNPFFTIHQLINYFHSL